MERSLRPDCKTAEDLIDKSNHQLIEAHEQVQSISLIEQHALSFERQLNEASDLNSDLQVAFTNSQNEVKELEKRYNALHKSTTARLLRVEGLRKQSEANTQMALMRVQELTEELQECKDELFNIQPPNQVADTHIGAEWEALCSGITSWIDDQSGGIDDLRVQLRRLKANEFSEVVDKYWGEDRQLVANHYSRHPNITDGLLRYNVHRLLEDMVFHDRVYMVGLHPRDAKILHRIERLMADMEPQRGEE